MSHVIDSTRFHLRHGWFNVREQFSDLTVAIAGNILIPFFVWLMAQVWERFNSHQGNFTKPQVIVYVAIAELLFMTFIRSQSIARASADFSISLIRPRSWLVTSFSGIVGRSFGSRMIMLAVLWLTLPLIGAKWDDTVAATLRLFILLPWLTLLQGLTALFFSSAQVLWHQTNYLLMPIGKFFLVLGGVLGPLADFSDPWRSWLLLISA